MSSAGTLPPLENRSAGEGAFLVALSFCLLVFAFIATALRSLVTLTQRRGFGIDDVLLIAAIVTTVPQTVMTERAVDSGLGEHMTKLSAQKVTAFYKYLYASEILAIIPMACAKLSITWLIFRIAGRSMRRLCQAVGVSILLWTVFSIFALAFQCGASRPWLYTPQRCDGNVWYGVTVLNMLTDFALATFFIPEFWKIQTGIQRRIQLISLLGVRIIVCILAIVQLVFISSAIHDADQTRSRIALTALNQCIMNLSIITATIPSLHRSLANLQTGHSGTRIPQSQMDRVYGDGNGTKGISSHEMKSGTSSKGRSKNYSIPSMKGTRSKTSPNRGNATLREGQSAQQFCPEGWGESIASVEHGPKNMTDTGSRTSDGSEKMIIRQTVGWDVEYVDRE